MSVLVTTTTTGARTSRSWRAMKASPLPTGWSAGTQKTITSTSDSVSRTTSLSRLPSRLLGLCSPGVSTSTIWPPGRCTTPRIACRVVWGRLLTMPTFSPTSALVSVVLPALGRPTRATKPLRCGCCSGVLTRNSLPPGTHVLGRASGVLFALPGSSISPGAGGTLQERVSAGGAEGSVGAGQVHRCRRREVADGGQALLLHGVRSAHDRGRLQAFHAAGHRGGDRGLQR